MVRGTLPPGFRFSPIDVELIMYYLRRKVLGKKLLIDAIAELDIYKYSPWDLPDKSCLRSGDLEWYFFCPRDRKYASGSRINRATETGYWKTTGRDRDICCSSRNVGIKKTLVFHLGRAPKGDRTNWVMYEYRLTDQKLADKGISQDSYVLCKVFEKSGAGPKNGEHHCAPFNEEDWEDDDDVVDNLVAPFPVAVSHPPVVGYSDQQNNIINSNIAIDGGACCFPDGQDPCQKLFSDGEENPEMFEMDEIERLMAYFQEDGPYCADETNEVLDSCNLQGTHEASPPLNGYDIYNGLEDLNTNTDLNAINRSFIPNSFGAEYGFDQILPVDNALYLEMDDFNRPLINQMETCHSDYIQLDAMRDHYTGGSLSGMCNSSPTVTADLPCTCEANTSTDTGIYESDCGPETPVANQGADEQSRGKAYDVSQSMERGVEHNRASSYSRLQCLLDSIPAHPASAAEHPCSITMGNESKGSNNGNASSIHAKAEVTAVRCCGLTNDALSGKLGELPCYDDFVWCKSLPTKEFGKNEVPTRLSSSCDSCDGSGFAFVFLVRTSTAFFRIVALALAARILKHSVELVEWFRLSQTPLPKVNTTW